MSTSPAPTAPAPWPPTIASHDAWARRDPLPVKSRKNPMLRPLTAALLIAFAAAPACAQAPAQERVLRITSPWEVRTYDPARIGWMFTRLGVGETLVAIGPNGELAPGLAERYEVLADGLTWRLHLRARRFHDGSAVTAEAVVASLTRLRRSPGSQIAAMPLAEMRAVDARTVEIVTTRPFSLLPAFLAQSATAILGPASFDADGQATRMVASGPYRLLRNDGGTRLELEAVARDGEPMPTIRRVLYLGVENGDTRARMAEAGEAEIAYTILPAAADRLRRVRTLEVRSAPLPRNDYLKLNVALPIFGDVRARQALNLAIDRAGIARAVMRNPNAAATQLIPAVLEGWNDPSLPPYTLDRARARALLAELGWRPGPDGILVRDGQRFAFELFMHPSRPELPPIAQALQAQWREIGVEATIRAGDSDLIITMHRDNTLQMAATSRNFMLLPDAAGTLAQDFGAEGGVWGAMNWRSDVLVEALGAYERAFDEPARAALRQRMTRILHDELPVIPIVWLDHIVAVSRSIANVTVDPFEASYFLERIAWAD
jgi:peptide/nickel transport system substrate-binding protein